MSWLRPPPRPLDQPQAADTDPLSGDTLYFIIQPHVITLITQLTSLSSALSLASSLTSLDCSHNRITGQREKVFIFPNILLSSDCTGLESLSLLSCLSLSYNVLTYVPSVHPSAPLTTLRLSYNNIEQV